MVDTVQIKCFECRKMSPSDARFCIHCAAPFATAQTERIQAGATVQLVADQRLDYSTVALDLLALITQNVIRHWQNIAILIGVICLWYAMAKSGPIVKADPAWQAPPAVSNSYNDNSINLCFSHCR